MAQKSRKSRPALRLWNPQGTLGLRLRVARVGRQPGLVLSAAFCWALSPIFIRAGLKDLPSPVLGVTVGVTASALGYGLVLLFQRKTLGRHPIGREALGFKLIAGLLVGLSTWARWVALGLAPVAVVLAITMVSVPMVIWLSPLVRPTSGTCDGCLMGRSRLDCWWRLVVTFIT